MLCVRATGLSGYQHRALFSICNAARDVHHKREWEIAWKFALVVSGSNFYIHIWVYNSLPLTASTFGLMMKHRHSHFGFSAQKTDFNACLVARGAILLKPRIGQVILFNIWQQIISDDDTITAVTFLFSNKK